MFLSVISKLFISIFIVLFAGTSPMLHAAYKELNFEQMNNRDTHPNDITRLYHSELISWKVKQTAESSIWDNWEYDFGVPQLLTGQTDDTYYGMGLWQPVDDDPSFSDPSVKDWLLNHGVNFSFSTKTDLTNIRYRIDMRWHEDTDTEFLIQMHWPFK